MSVCLSLLICLELFDFSTTEHPVDLRPVSKLEFVRCGPVEKNQSDLSLSLLNCGSPTKFEEAFFF